MKPQIRTSAKKVRRLSAISSVVKTRQNCACGQAYRRALNIKARNTCSTCSNRRKAKGHIIILFLFSRSGKRQPFRSFLDQAGMRPPDKGWHNSKHESDEANREQFQPQAHRFCCERCCEM